MMVKIVNNDKIKIQYKSIAEASLGEHTSDLMAASYSADEADQMGIIKGKKNYEDSDDGDHNDDASAKQ